MSITVIDFETYYDNHFGLKRNKLSIPEYVHDPRFHVHGLAVRWPDGHTQFRRDVEAALAEMTRQFGDELESTVVVGHHLQFDLYMLNYLHNVRPRHFVDTMLLAHHVHGRRGGGGELSASLRAMAEYYGLPMKGDLDFMNGVRHPDPQQLAALCKYARHDVDLTETLMKTLLPQITRPEIELPLMMQTVRLFTERSIRIDTESLDELVAEIEQKAARVFEQADVTPEEVSQNGKFVELLEGALKPTGRSVPVKAGKNGAIPATAKGDAAMQALVNDPDPTVAALARARLEKKATDQKLARLQRMKQIAQATGGRLPPYLVYYGAHTGRFAGGGGMNVQNLGRDDVGSRIRGLLTAAHDGRFIIADLAQIEARMTAWFAGQQDMLNAFAQKRDLYSEFASEVLGREVRKPRVDDAPAIAAELNALRQIGKQAILGLGFGMGPKKYVDNLQRESATAKLFAQGQLTKQGCVQIVRAYRQRYSFIPLFWKTLEQCVQTAANGGSAEIEKLRFNRVDDTILIWLPSGRALRYPRVRWDSTPRTIVYLDSDGEEQEFVPDEPGLIYGQNQPLYGGLLTENVVQAVARDLLVEAMLDLEKEGLPILFHVHDELVAEVVEGQVAMAIDRVRQRLEQPPAWAANLPVACEVQDSPVYTK